MVPSLGLLGDPVNSCPNHDFIHLLTHSFILLRPGGRSGGTKVKAPDHT